MPYFIEPRLYNSGIHTNYAVCVKTLISTNQYVTLLWCLAIISRFALTATNKCDAVQEWSCSSDTRLRYYTDTLHCGELYVRSSLNTQIQPSSVTSLSAKCQADTQEHLRTLLDPHINHNLHTHISLYIIRLYTIRHVSVAGWHRRATAHSSLCSIPHQSIPTSYLRLKPKLLHKPSRMKMYCCKQTMAPSNSYLGRRPELRPLGTRRNLELKNVSFCFWSLSSLPDHGGLQPN